MNLFDDIKSPILLRIKGGLFAAVALLSAALIVFFENRWYEIAVLVICVWSSCRFYYYLFYVLESYIGTEKNASVFSMLLQIFRRRNGPIAGEVPPESMLFAEKGNYDWFDSYRICVCDPNHELTPRKMGELFLDVTPRWVLWLFALRNAVARRFGLHGSPSEPIGNVKDFFNSLPLNEGDKIEIVEIARHDETELVAGAKDWHLDFLGSLLLLDDPDPQHRWVVLTTVVKFKHFFGRLYFLPIKPFHKMIVRSLLSRAQEQNEKKQKPERSAAH